MSTSPVIIVGGGIAGLGAALALKERGHRVMVLEANAEAGGRMRSHVVQGYTVDTGAQFLAGRGAYRHLWRLMDRLGLSEHCQPIGTQTNALVRGGQLYLGKWTDPQRFLATPYLSLNAKLSLSRLLPAVVQAMVRLSPTRPDQAHFLDDEDAKTWAENLVGEEAAQYVLAPAFGATFDTDLSHLSRAFLLNTMTFMARGFDVHSPVGGPGAITRALAEKLDVRCGHRVTGLKATPSKVLLSVEVAGEKTREIKAKGVVLAVPGPALDAFSEALSAQERSFLHHVRYTKGVIVTFCLKGQPATLQQAYGLGLPPPEGYGLYGAAVDHQKAYAAPPGAGLLNCALTEAEAANRFEHTDEALCHYARAELERSPVGALGPAVATQVDRWENLLPCFYTGYHKRLHEFLHRKQSTPRVAFAGDYLTGPFTEAAYVSGLRAARQLHLGWLGG